MRCGLEVLLEDPSALMGANVGLCCNHTSVDHQFRHAIDLLVYGGVNLKRLLGPEHGVRATAQDMEEVGEVTDSVTGLPTVSLYGRTSASLHPQPDTLSDLDILLFDIQDIGARYYTYQATLGFLMEVAGTVDTEVWVLDRPNPIDGVHVEGNVVEDGFASFVGAYPIAIRHGMTVGELAGYFRRFCDVECETKVVKCEGWSRELWFDQHDLPWVYPSPNMPTLETATIYPGMCLVEATNLSEGRGTTKPFHLVGAPWIDPRRFARLCDQGAAEAGLEGVCFRPAAFKPGFQKHANVNCGGVEVHVVNRLALNSTLLGMVVLEAALRCDEEHFGWRTEPYEFVSDPPAIDLLTGSAEYRRALESLRSVREVLDGWEGARGAFLHRRSECLLY
ncbi:MAG: DUF1343 domain-containing protein [Proteobacteria bacterium]|jgi:uncharacterized protein YbbC (DUF1343 family)|nr:DUF1343 domain-containing protein [Pseudomonadota bacterium]